MKWPSVNDRGFVREFGVESFFESCGMRISSLEDLSPLEPVRPSRARLRLLYLIPPSFL